MLTGESLFMTVFQNHGQGKRRVAFGAPWGLSRNNVVGYTASAGVDQRNTAGRAQCLLARRPLFGQGLARAYSDVPSRRWEPGPCH